MENEKPLNIDIDFSEFIREFEYKKPIDIHTRTIIICKIRTLLKNKEYDKARNIINKCRSIMYKLENKLYSEMSNIDRQSSEKLFREIENYIQNIKLTKNWNKCKICDKNHSFNSNHFLSFCNDKIIDSNKFTRYSICNNCYQKYLDGKLDHLKADNEFYEYIDIEMIGEEYVKT